jgi:pimeloyl-ACP methyl ester carboxylesterase
MKPLKASVITVMLACLSACSMTQEKPNSEPVNLHSACAVGAESAALNEDQYVLISGVKQWVSIRGEDCSNPVVLMVHGGPGNPLSLYHDSLFEAFEKDFTIVHWDQRGSGRTYEAQFASEDLSFDMLTNAGLSVDLLASDGNEVAAYIRQRLNKDKIIISGSSWGSFLAVKMIHAEPSLYHFYVGASQLVNAETMYATSYEKLKSIAEEKNDQAALAMLDEMGAPPWSAPRSFGMLRRIVKKYEFEAVPQLSPWQIDGQYQIEEPNFAYMYGEEFSFLRYIGLEGDPGMLEDVALDKCCTDLKIPVYFLHGKKDYLTTYEVTEAYYSTIDAPAKELRLLENTGHDQTPEMLEVLAKILNMGANKHISKL